MHDLKEERKKSEDVRTIVDPDRKAETLILIIREQVTEGSGIHTDCWGILKSKGPRLHSQNCESSRYGASFRNPGLILRGLSQAGNQQKIGSEGELFQTRNSPLFSVSNCGVGKIIWTRSKSCSMPFDNNIMTTDCNKQMNKPLIE